MEPAPQPDLGLSEPGQCSAHPPPWAQRRDGVCSPGPPGTGWQGWEDPEINYLQKKLLGQSFSPKVAASMFYISVSLALARRPQLLPMLVSGSSPLVLTTPPAAIRVCSLALPWAGSITPSLGCTDTQHLWCWGHHLARPLTQQVMVALVLALAPAIAMFPFQTPA